jgi:hypothetical protein
MRQLLKKTENEFRNIQKESAEILYLSTIRVVKIFKLYQSISSNLFFFKLK